MKFRLVSVIAIAALLVVMLGSGTHSTDAQSATMAATAATAGATVNVVTSQITGGTAVGTPAARAAANASPTAPLPAGLTAQLIRGIALRATTIDGVPNGIDQAAWEDAFGTILSPDPNVVRTTPNIVVVRMGNLVPNGVYTIWWGAEGAATTIRSCSPP